MNSTTDAAGLHQIGEAAEAVGLSLRTIRYYDEVGLIPPSGRTPSGFPLYTAGDIELLRLVKQMKPLDFTLEERCATSSTLSIKPGPAPTPTRYATFSGASPCVRPPPTLAARPTTAAEGLAHMLRLGAQQQAHS